MAFQKAETFSQVSNEESLTAWKTLEAKTRESLTIKSTAILNCADA